MKQEKTFSFKILTLSGDQLKKILAKGPSLINFGTSCICLKGSAEIIVNSKIHKVQKGTLITILPDTLFYLISYSSDLKVFIAVCDANFMELVNISNVASLYQYVKEHPSLQLEEHDQHRIIEFCNFLKINDLRNESPNQIAITHHLIMATVHEIIGVIMRNNIFQTQPISRKNKYYWDFIDMLSINYKLHRNAEFYASQLCISPHYLSAICKEFSGITATEEINKYIISIIKSLLISTDKSIQQISDELNFPNPSFFSQFFKRYEKVTPNYFRNNFYS